jgi:hypothetical protein
MLYEQCQNMSNTQCDNPKPMAIWRIPLGTWLVIQAGKSPLGPHSVGYPIKYIKG